MVERRTARRVAFTAPTFIEDVADGERTGYGKVLNISNMGAFISTSEDFAPNDELVVSIHLVSGDARLSVTMPGRVARKTPEGFGFRSPHLDLATLIHFGRIMEGNYHAPWALQNAFCNYAVEAVYPSSFVSRRTS